ncbi:MAG: enoyl-CoA hydratase-related protein [Pseudomonadota bacterium]
MAIADALTGFETLVVDEPAADVLTVTMTRPAARNAMNTQMMSELRDCFSHFYVGPDHARCLILTGAGDRAFCAGADLKERDGMDDADWRRQHAIIEQAIRAMMVCPVPVIAAVNGAAFAGGCELALAADFIYAVETARFAQTEVALGIIPGAMGTQNLSRATSLRRAKEVILTGTPFDAREASEWGLVNALFPSVEALRDGATETARRISDNAPIAVRQAKAAIDKSADLDRANGYAYEIEAYNRTVGTEDRQEGIRAFNDKRAPQFRGR